MRSFVAETLTRLRRCRDQGQPAPVDLCEDAIECLRRVNDAEVVRTERDALIRQAADLLPPAPPYRKAKMLLAEVRAMQRVWRVLVAQTPTYPPVTVRDALHAARLISELPDSERQFYRLLRDGTCER